MKQLKRFFSVLKYSDRLLWLLCFVCASYGLILILSIDISSSSQEGLFKTQLIAMIIGFILAITLALTNYRYICKLWYIFASIGIIAMVYTFIFGWSAHGIGGKAWISIASFNLQPSEIVKIFFMISFATHAAYLERKNLIKKFRGVLLLLLHAAVPISMVLLQGDDGTLLIFIFMFLAMALGAGVLLRYFIIAGLCVSAAVPLLWKFFLGEYQRQRFLTLFNLEENIQTYGWQQYQAKVSIASGKILGKGLFSSSRVKSGIVSVQESDFIFSVAGESLGFLGCFLIIVLLLLLSIRVLHIAYSSKDISARVICFGFFALISMQSIINIGMCLAMVPVVGITLPFFSSGGSSIISVCLGLGLVQSIYINNFDEHSVKFKIRNSLVTI